jgi:tRNA-dihydrouridine synthase B
MINAPMYGVTDHHFRQLAQSLGTPMMVSEMIAFQIMLRENRQTLNMAELDGFGGPASVQLAGCDPATMAEAAKLVRA